MNEKVDIQGYWFLPDDAETRVAGTLYFEPDKDIRLELIGSFYETQNFLQHLSEDRTIPTNVIWGESSDGKPITLINCHAYGTLNFSASFPVQKFSVGYALTGIHIQDASSAVFSSITVKLSLLTSWVNNYLVKYTIQFGDSGANGFGLSYQMDNINPIQVQLDADTALEMEFACTPPPTATTEVVTVHQFYQLNISASQKFSFLHFLGKANRFNAFLQLGTLSEPLFEKITLINPDDYQKLANGRKYFHPVELYYKQHVKAAGNSPKKDFLFEYDSIAGGFSDIIKKWFAFDQQMAPILKHLINSIAPKDFFDTGDFLVVIQALEGYATRFRPNIPKTGKHITLKDQLNCLSSEFSFIPSIKNLKLDIDTATNSRHYYSHFFTKKQNAHVADGIELYKLTQSLKAILICCVLGEMGFDQQTMLSIMNKYHIGN